MDVACGTGVLARSLRAVVRTQGRVVGTDAAPGMLAVAAELAPDVEWVQCAAEALAVVDASFDVVVSQFGMMFFADRAQALRGMHRVLRPGGTLHLTLWRSLEDNPAYAAASALLEQEVVGAGGAYSEELSGPIGSPMATSKPSACRSSGSRICSTGGAWVARWKVA